MTNLTSKISLFNISNTALAEKSGIDLKKLLLILRGTAEPTLSEIRKLAKALKTTPDFLLGDVEINQHQRTSVLFRKLPSISQLQVSEISLVISNLFKIIDKEVFNFSALKGFSSVENTFQGARELAQTFRYLYCGNDSTIPLTDLPILVSRELNCILLVHELGNKTDGASAIIDGVPIIIISPRFPPRMLFTLAHELGHILKHHKDAADFLLVEDTAAPKKLNHSDEEAFAHAFASELLMPSEGIGITLKVIRDRFKLAKDAFGEIELLYLSRIYGVSFEAAALRCENLGLIPVGSANSLYRSISKEFGNPEKRARELGLPERQEIEFPLISENVIVPAVQKVLLGEISIERASELLEISPQEFYKYNSAN